MFLASSRFSRLLVGPFLALLSLLCACKSSKGEVGEVSGLYKSGSGWPGATASVCFSRSGIQSPNFQNTVREVLENEVNDRTSFQFTGFNPCSASKSDDIEVFFSDVPTNPANDAGRASFIGKPEPEPIEQKVDDLLYGLQHKYPNFSRKNLIYIPTKYRISSKNPLATASKEILKNVILHEFGHAIGLYHEASRRDNKDGQYCDQPGAGKQDPRGIQVGPYDQASIMNLCNKSFGFESMSLSKGDVAAIRTLYPNGPGGNYGYRLRCGLEFTKNCRLPMAQKSPINWCEGNDRDCREISGEQCAIATCRGGSLVCEQPERFLSCLREKGGLACMGPTRGNCNFEK